MPIRNRVCHFRPLEYDDFQRVVNLATNVSKELPNVWAELNRIKNTLKNNPNKILSRDINLERKSDDLILHNLPIPDFDDTGFVGRIDSYKKLKKATESAFPVISVVGEGGIGKTSLVLKYAYDLLDSTNPIFEMIIWQTAKTHQLTVNDIKKIDHAIEDSMGMFSNIVTNMLDKNTSDDISEKNIIKKIKDYMESFSVLLILDNLESVLDEKMKEFISELVSSKSKILITSRISLGLLDKPIILGPLDKKESEVYFRAVSDSLFLKDLKKSKSTKINEYTRKLKGNPLFIKWFLHAISTGVSPEKVLRNQKMILEYCMDDIYGHLSKKSKEILDVFLVVPGTFALSTIVFLSQEDNHTVEDSLKELINSNFIFMKMDENSQHSSYELRNLARNYLTNFYNPPLKRQQELLARKRKLASMADEFLDTKTVNIYDPNYIELTHTHDVVVARYLRDALLFSKQRKNEIAIDTINKAKEIAPEYPEVYRVSAFINSILKQDIVAARNDYEIALEIDPDNVRVKYFYAGLLSRDFNEHESAAKILEKCLDDIDDKRLIFLELARNYMILKKYDKAENYLNQYDLYMNSSEIKINNKIHKKYLLQHVSLRQRLIEHYVEDKHDVNLALIEMQKCIDIVNDNYQALDMITKGRLRKIIQSLFSCSKIAKSCGNTRQYELTRQYLAWLSDTASVALENNEGIISRIMIDKNFGFIENNETKDLFFHNSELINLEWSEDIIGKKVTYSLGNNSKGQIAENIFLV